MMKINNIVIIEDEKWPGLLPNLQVIVDKSVSVLCKHAPIPDKLRHKTIEINIVLTNDNAIEKLNNDFRNKNKPTNVLSFSLLDNEDVDIIIGNCSQTGEDIPAGDIIIALETIKSEAKEQNKNLNDHFSHILIHGILHILGYDHIDKNDAFHMEKLEVKILETLNIKDPYE